MIDRIKKYLRRQGFREIPVNKAGIFLYMLEYNESFYAVILCFMPENAVMCSEEYNYLLNQIYESLRKTGIQTINIHGIIFTDTPENMRGLCENTPGLWMVDSKEYRLILYENQASDFFGIRKGLESILAGEEPIFETYKKEQLNSLGRHHQISKNLWKFGIVNTLMIFINVVVFLVLELKNGSDTNYFLLEHGAMYWPAIMEGKEYYRLFTYMFLHGGIDHLFNNMLILLFIGDSLEKVAGKWKYLIIYFGSGILAGIVSMVYNIYKDIPAVSVGASGAIFGVVSALGYIIVINKGRVADLSTRQILIFIALSLYSGFTSQGVDNAAHVGGLLAGIVLAALLYRRKIQNQRNSDNEC